MREAALGRADFSTVPGTDLDGVQEGIVSGVQPHHLLVDERVLARHIPIERRFFRFDKRLADSNFEVLAVHDPLKPFSLSNRVEILAFAHCTPTHFKQTTTDTQVQSHET